MNQNFYSFQNKYEDVSGFESIRKRVDLRVYYTLFSFNALIGIFAVGDLLISTYVDGAAIAGAFYGSNYFQSHKKLCQSLAFVCTAICQSVFFSIALLAINRYIYICHHFRYKKIFTRCTTFVYCVLIWFFAALIHLTMIFIDVDNEHNQVEFYDVKVLQCASIRNGDLALLKLILILIVPCVCVLMCYIKIFYYVMTRRPRINSKTVVLTNDEFSRRIIRVTTSKKSLKIVKTFFITYLTFTICTLPFGIIAISDRRDKLPFQYYLWTGFLAHGHASLTPILYFTFNQLMRNGFYTVLNIKHSFKSISSN